MAKQSSPPLNRQRFIDAALEVVHEVGVDKLSMRKVATYLGVSPMAMYKHFPNKEELLAATLDAVIARADVFPDDNLPWQAWVEHVARGMFNSLSEETSWVPMLGSMRLGTQAALVTDAFVERLSREGFTFEQSVRGYLAVIQVVIGGVCLHSSMTAEISKATPGDPQNAKKSESKLTPQTLSYLAQKDQQPLRVAPSLDATLPLDQLAIGLPMIITSLQAQLAENQ